MEFTESSLIIRKTFLHIISDCNSWFSGYLSQF